MLCSLHIENIALIRRLDLEPSSGFCAFTGETGAGKSILIDAIGLLCGNRSEKELIRSGEDYALVEGMFFLPEGEVRERLTALSAEFEEDGTLFLQRKITSDGRSSAKLGSRAIPLSFLREISSMLLRIHGQQDTRGLSTEERQRELLDAFAHDSEAKRAYEAAYSAWNGTAKELKALSENALQLAERSDLLKYQQQELKMAKLKPGEEAELLAQHKILANAEKITENAAAAYEALYIGERSALVQLQTAKAAVNRLVGIIPEGEELKGRLEDLYAEITDVSDTLNGYAEGGEVSASELTRIEDRLEKLSALQRKYRTDEQGLLDKLASVTHDLELEESADDRIEELKNRLKKEEETLHKMGKLLTEARSSAARTLSAQVQTSLADLDMPKVRFEISIEPAEPTVSGEDTVSFAVSANAGEEPKPIGKIASGGELSRIMLCLQVALADVEQMPTLIFDEIDTGISGKTNEKIGRMMQRIAGEEHTQVICVTHAAQLAARAAHQYRISKSEKDGRTETEIRELDEQGRIEELSRIMGGLTLTDAVRAAAKELLDGRFD